MVKQRRSVDVLTMERWDDLSLEIERIPDGAAVVDLREGIDEEDLLAPGFIDLPFSKAVDNYEVLPRDRPYVLCCRVGLKSAYLAEKMQEAGFESYSFEGGIPALEDYVDNER
jgi:thiamine biosynthesis protein ThiI